MPEAFEIPTKVTGLPISLTDGAKEIWKATDFAGVAMPTPAGSVPIFQTISEDLSLKETGSPTGKILETHLTFGGMAALTSKFFKSLEKFRTSQVIVYTVVCPIFGGRGPDVVIGESL